MTLGSCTLAWDFVLKGAIKNAVEQSDARPRNGPEPSRHAPGQRLLRRPEKESMKRSRWTTEEQRKQIGSAMAIATTANLLLGLRCTETGKEYVDSMVTRGGIDRELCDGGTWYILIPMLPFAVELCLKGIRSQGGREFLRIHNLKSLWTDLDAVEQIGIRKRVNSPAWRNEEKPRRDALVSRVQ